jgi:hypothetical protein
MMRAEATQPVVDPMQKDGSPPKFDPYPLSNRVLTGPPGDFGFGHRSTPDTLKVIYIELGVIGTQGFDPSPYSSIFYLWYQPLCWPFPTVFC